ncbi:MAG: hypothetical protein D6683_12060, partial [Actinomyces sp.]
MDLLVVAAESVPTVPATVSDANWFLEHAWLVPLFPALSFVGILLFGKRLPRKGSELGIAAVALSFVFSLVVVGAWIDHRD